MRIKLIFGILTFILSAFLQACGGGSAATGSVSASVGDSNVIRAASSDGTINQLSLKSELTVSASCYLLPQDFTALNGTFIPSSTTCGEFIGQTDAGTGAYSIGRFEYNQSLSDDITIHAGVQKVSGNLARPTEIYFLGGAFGWAFSGGQASYYLYESESHWTGWIKTNMLNVNALNQVTLHQTGTSIRVLVNGSYLDSFELETVPSQNRVSVFFKGEPGQREQMRFSDFLVLDRGRTHNLLAESDGTDLSRLTLVDTSQLAAPTATVDFGVLDDVVNASVKRLTLQNTSSAYIARPRLVFGPGAELVEIAFAHPDSCIQVTQLAPRQSCSVYVAAASVAPTASAFSLEKDSEHARAGVTSRTRSVIAFGNAYQPLQTTFARTNPSSDPRLSHLSPSQLRVGRRTQIAVNGSNLPSTMTVSIPGVNCENQGHTVLNKVYCTASASLAVKASLSDTASGQLMGYLPVSISPMLYADPVDVSYLRSVERGFGQYVNGLGYHTGWDVMTANANPSVRAVADGTVVYNTIDASKYKTNHDRYWSAFIVVKHNGFCAYYAHLDNSAAIKVGASVRRDQVLGKVRNAYDADNELYTANNHLHISFSTQSKCQSSGWGYKSKASDVTSIYADPSGFVSLQ